MDQLRSDRDEVLEWLEEYLRENQRDIDLFKRIKYAQGYKDREQGKEPRYDLEEEAFGDEVGSDEYEKDEDMEVEVPDSRIAQVETSEAPSEVPLSILVLLLPLLREIKLEERDKLGQGRDLSHTLHLYCHFTTLVS